LHVWAHFKTIARHRFLVCRYCFRLGLYGQGLSHDLSKFSPTEFWVGAKYFQGDRSPNDAERRAVGYSTAWMHHKGRNRHHSAPRAGRGRCAPDGARGRVPPTGGTGAQPPFSFAERKCALHGGKESNGASRPRLWPGSQRRGTNGSWACAALPCKGTNKQRQSGFDRVVTDCLCFLFAAAAVRWLQIASAFFLLPP
jgi:hypothetical protein